MTNKDDDIYFYDPATYQDNEDPLGWFEALYRGAKGGLNKVFWVDLEPTHISLTG